jgi:hypothetical protein
MVHFLWLAWHASNPGPGYVRFDEAIGWLACELAWFNVLLAKRGMIRRIVWTG